MNKTLTRLVSALMALLLLPALAIGETTPVATDDQGRPYVLDAFDGTALDLSQHKGKAIWLNFYTGWCSYCMKEMPDIKQTFETYDPDEVAIILVHAWSGEGADASAEVIERFGLEAMLHVEDQDLALSQIIGLEGFPTSIFINKDGYYTGRAYALSAEEMAGYLDGMGVALRDGAAAEAATDAATDAPTAAPETTAEVVQ